MKYYISRSGQQYGPYSLEDLQNMKAQGRVDPNDLAWGEGMASWTPVSQVLESSAASAAAAPQPYTPPQQQYTPPQQQYTPPQQQYTPPQQQYTPPQQQYTPPQQQYTPPQQQYTPPQQQYTAPSYSAPQQQYSPQAQPFSPQQYTGQPVAGGPMPPSMHWALVILLGVVVPFFALVWFFIELGFVKKIDPANASMKQLITGIASIVAGFILFFVLAAGAGASERPILAVLGGFVLFAAYITTFVFMLMAIFGMRRSIQNYYNTVEPIGLKLSGVMTFFFSIYYFQYHFSRIAVWKQTGRLE